MEKIITTTYCDLCEKEVTNKECESEFKVCKGYYQSDAVQWVDVRILYGCVGPTKKRHLCVECTIKALEGVLFNLRNSGGLNDKQV